MRVYDPLLAGTIMSYKIKVQHPSFCKDGGIHYSLGQIRIGALARGRRGGEYYCLLIAQVMRSGSRPGYRKLITLLFSIFQYEFCLRIYSYRRGALRERGRDVVYAEAFCIQVWILAG